jgi:hypothetical protein
MANEFLFPNSKEKRVIHFSPRLFSTIFLEMELPIFSRAEGRAVKSCFYKGFYCE